MIIKCNSKKDIIQIESELRKKIGNDYEIYQEELQDARMKVVDIIHHFDTATEELEDDINNRNFKGTDLFCNVVHVYRKKWKDTYNAIITVTADTHEFITQCKYKLHVGHQLCYVYDDLNIQPCYNCGIIGHSGKKCDNTTTCLRCSKNHETKNCDYKNTIQCSNCTYRNNKFNLNCDVNHIATDSDNCQYIKYHINRKINSTDYLVKPKVSRYFGYTGKRNNNSSVVQLQNIENNDITTNGKPSKRHRNKEDKNTNKLSVNNNKTNAHQSKQLPPRSNKKNNG